MFNVGLKIREKRESLGLSIRQLSIHVNIAASHLGAIERGESSITIDKLRLICDFFGLSLEEFFKDSNENEVLTITPELKKLLIISKTLSPEKIKILTDFIQNLLL